MTFYCTYCYLRAFVTPFSIVSAVDLKQNTIKCLLGPTLSACKPWNNKLLQLLTDVQKSQWIIEGHKKDCDPK